MVGTDRAAGRRTYGFTLILGGIPEITEDVADALFGGGCDDSSPSMRAGICRLGFDREAESLEEAIRSAIADVVRAVPESYIIRVEPDDPATAGAGQVADVEDAQAIGAINAALELRGRVPEFADAVEMLRWPGVYGAATGAAPAPGKGATPSL